MEIRNTTPCNQSIHAVKGKGIKVKPLLTIPGDGALYISDEDFGKYYASECEAQCKAGIFKIGLDTVESVEDVLQREADELAAAIALVAKFAKQEEIKQKAHDAANQVLAEQAVVDDAKAVADEKSRLITAGVGSVKGEPIAKV